MQHGDPDPGGKKRQESNQHSYMTIPKSQEKLDPHGQTEKGTAKLHSSNRCGNNTRCCSDKKVVLVRGGHRSTASRHRCMAFRVSWIAAASLTVERPDRSHHVTYRPSFSLERTMVKTPK